MLSTVDLKSGHNIFGGIIENNYLEELEVDGRITLK
jgi:hypothetical protein